jgi:hypothetical protein
MTSNRLHRGATGLIYAILCGAFAAELRASTAYVISNGSDQLGTVDLAIGVFTLISSTAGSLAGIAANDGTLYEESSVAISTLSIPPPEIRVRLETPG